MFLTNQRQVIIFIKSAIKGELLPALKQRHIDVSWTLDSMHSSVATCDICYLKYWGLKNGGRFTDGIFKCNVLGWISLYFWLKFPMDPIQSISTKIKIMFFGRICDKLSPEPMLPKIYIVIWLHQTAMGQYKCFLFHYLNDAIVQFFCKHALHS